MIQDLIGKLLSNDPGRDAIHIAVAPVVCADRSIKPGARIGFAEIGNCERVSSRGEPIGIADPFLEQPVTTGERFFMFLFPNTITTLRHEWIHPAFASVVSGRDRIAEARAEIQQIADAMGGDGDDDDPSWYGPFRPMTYERLMGAAKEWIDAEEYCVEHGGQSWQEGFPFQRFWPLYSIVTGEAVPSSRNRNFFSCSC